MSIKTKTNLHVGSESINYDIVDKTVQRDSISNLPVINASSQKGALRYFFEIKEEIEDVLIDIVFGKDGEDASQGYVKFLDSYLLFLPLRANNQPFYYATSKSSLLNYCDFYDYLGYDLSEARTLIENLKTVDCIYNELGDAYIEDIHCGKSTDNMVNILDLLGLDVDATQVALLSENNFIDAVKHLPIIARNKIATNEAKTNGNLWYEEMVPRESIFYTAMLDYTQYSNRLEKLAKNKIQTFYDTLNTNLVQIGANASIGFGLCSYSLVDLTRKETVDAQ